MINRFYKEVARATVTFNVWILATRNSKWILYFRFILKKCISSFYWVERLILFNHLRFSSRSVAPLGFKSLFFSCALFGLRPITTLLTPTDISLVNKTISYVNHLAINFDWELKHRHKFRFTAKLFISVL